MTGRERVEHIVQSSLLMGAIQKKERSRQKRGAERGRWRSTLKKRKKKRGASRKIGVNSDSNPPPPPIPHHEIHSFLSWFTGFLWGSTPSLSWWNEWKIPIFHSLWRDIEKMWGESNSDHHSSSESLDWLISPRFTEFLQSSPSFSAHYRFTGSIQRAHKISLSFKRNRITLIS